MKVLIVHNRYQHAGGEDVVAASEAELLERRGHQVVWYVRENKDLSTHNAVRRVADGFATVWAQNSYSDLSEIIRRESPDIAHFHNTFPLISPAAYYACKRQGVPVVQTLHNYRLLCPSATFFRSGRTCESCLGRFVPWPAVVHRCYRGNFGATAALTGMLVAHRFLRTWHTQVDRFIALSDFSRDRFVEAGLPAAKITVKANFVCQDPGAKPHRGEYALFAGRLFEYKGVGLLVEAWRRLRFPIPLRIAGTGPLLDKLSAQIAESKLETVSLLGPRSHTETVELMRGARYLVFPSIWYEVFPLTIIEAFACGLPVIASRLGAMQSAILDGKTGLHFAPGDASQLAQRCEWAWTHEAELERIGRNARSEFLQKYSADRNYQELMAIYESLVAPQPAIPYGRSPASKRTRVLTGEAKTR